jgi:hypothetical protein
MNQFFDGRCWVISTNNNQVAGRTPEQAQKTYNLIESGQVLFDSDGIGRRVKVESEK